MTPPPTHTSLLRPLLRDTAAAIAVPAALGYAAGNPLPLHLPSSSMLPVWWNTIQADPAQAIHPLLTVLIYLLWIGWAWHALWTSIALLWITLRMPAIALPAALRRVTPAAAVQALALGSMLTTQTAHAAAATPPATAQTRTTAQPAHQLPAQRSSRNQPTVTAPTTYTVQPGDTLWSIAQQQLGDSRAWPTIYQANENDPKPGGTHLTDPATIQPGWTLTIPTPATTVPNPATAAAPATTAPPTPAPTDTPHTAPQPAVTLPHPATPPDTATAPVAPRHAPSAATRPHPARTPAVAPTAPRTATDAPQTAHVPRATDVPHTAGWTFPGGYLGISLLTAIAAACAALLRNHKAPDIPHTVRSLAAVARRARAAHTYGYHPDEQTPGTTPPPHYTPQPGTPILGIGPEQAGEAAYDPEHLKILQLHGPGATDAAAALALSLLAADPTTPPPLPGLEPTHADTARTAFRVVIEPDLAHEFFGPIDHPDDPEWLVTTPLTAPALLTHELLPPDATPATPAPTGQATTTVLFASGTETDLAHTIQTAGSIQQPASVIIVGSTGTDPAAAQVVTQAHVNSDGHVTDTRGPAAAQFTGLRLQVLPRDLAHEIYRVLRNARAPRQQARHITEPGSTSSEDETALAPVTMPAPTIPAQPIANNHASPQPVGPPATAPLTLRLLGPIEIHGPAGTIPVTGDKTAALLALLALHPRGRTVAQIADQAWDGMETTGTDAIPIRSAIARARTLLRSACHDQNQPPGAELITAGPTGFKLNPKWITTDLAAHDHLEDTARQATDPAHRTELLQQAADLHRGELAEAIDDWDRDWLTSARAAYDRQATALSLELAEMNSDFGSISSWRMPVPSTSTSLHQLSRQV